MCAASFAGELHNQQFKITDSNDRVVQELLISYFYKGLHPEYLREKTSHLMVSTIDQVCELFREYCTPIMAKAANFSYLESRRKRGTPRLRLFPMKLDRHSSKSARNGTPLELHLNTPREICHFFYCKNCSGTHKSMIAPRLAACKNPRVLIRTTPCSTVRAFQKLTIDKISYIAYYDYWSERSFSPYTGCRVFGGF